MTHDLTQAGLAPQPDTARPAVKGGSNVQEHAPSNSDVGARPTKHFVIRSFACAFYSANPVAAILVGP